MLGGPLDSRTRAGRRLPVGFCHESWHSRRILTLSVARIVTNSGTERHIYLRINSPVVSYRDTLQSSSPPPRCSAHYLSRPQPATACSRQQSLSARIRRGSSSAVVLRCFWSIIWLFLQRRPCCLSLRGLLPRFVASGFLGRLQLLLHLHQIRGSRCLGLGEFPDFDEPDRGPVPRRCRSHTTAV